MNNIPNLAHRKHKTLTRVDFPDGTIIIGDAAFSLCPLLKQVIIPASVEHIGCAAFCGSGVEDVTFLGIPQEIEPSVFKGCDKLKRIAVPAGTIDFFAQYFSRSLLIEVNTKNTAEKQEPQYYPQPGREVRQLDIFGGGQTFVEQPNLFSTLHPHITENSTPQPTPNLFGDAITKRSTLTYNYHDFSWVKGDTVSLSDLFCGPTTLNGDPSYQFRRKCLFVFMKSKTAAGIHTVGQYAIPANTTHFTRKYQEKYGTRTIRIFLFICDDGKTATFYDEVKHVTTGNNNITIKSIL